MTDIERIELAIRRVLALPLIGIDGATLLGALVDELARMKPAHAWTDTDGARGPAKPGQPGYKLKWVP